jgi:hypothetical protein
MHTTHCGDVVVELHLPETVKDNLKNSNDASSTWTIRCLVVRVLIHFLLSHHKGILCCNIVAIILVIREYQCKRHFRRQLACSTRLLGALRSTHLDKQ